MIRTWTEDDSRALEAEADEWAKAHPGGEWAICPECSGAGSMYESGPPCMTCGGAGEVVAQTCCAKLEGRKLKQSQILREAARLMGRDGFTPYWRDGACGCFLQRTEAVTRNDEARLLALDCLHQVVGSKFSTFALIDNGWTGPGHTKDAVAALDIAADIREAEGL